MGSPAIFAGSRTKLLSSKGLLLKDGTVIDNDGVPNFIKNGHAEVDALGWATYADAAGAAPVDGTGGTANVTWTRSTSSPLSGTGSFVFTKDAANRQGQGVSYAFSIDPAYQARVLTIQFDYEVGSGTFVAGSSSADSDLTVWLYDVTNSVLIQPSSYKLLSNSSTIADTFQSTFQTSATGTSYRLIVHCSTTSASAYDVKFDNVQVTPTEYAYGTPITDLTSYTPIITTTSGTMTNYTASGFWKRDGGDLIMSATITFTGSVGTWAGPTFSLPPGLQIDFNKGAFFDGTGYLYRNGTGVINVSTVTHGTVVAASTIGTDKVRIGVSFIDTVSTSTTDALKIGATSLITQSFPESFVSGSTISIQEFRVPILGWSSSVQTSDQTSTRVIAAVLGAASATTTMSASGTIYKIALDTASYDTINGFDNSNDRYICSVPGYYQITGSYSLNVGTSVRMRTYIYKNGVAEFSSFGTGNNAGNTTAPVNGIVYCNSGDYIEMWGAQDSGTSKTTSAGLSQNYLSIQRISGPNQIAASETVAIRAYNISGQSIPNGTPTTITGWTKNYDTHGAFNASTGIFTAPISGKYRFTGSLIYASAVQTINSEYLLYIASNRVAAFYSQSTATTSIGLSGSDVFSLNAGTTVAIQTYQTTGTTKSLNGSDSSYCHVAIERVGN